MNRKKAGKSKAAKSMRNLPAKSLKAKTAKSVKGGGTSTKGTQPSEGVTINYGKINYDY